MVLKTQAEPRLAEDGRMLAAGWHGYMCGNCDHYHIDLFDDEGTVFATMVIMGNVLTEFGNKLLSIAAAQQAERMFVEKPTNRGGTA
jgi:hypothetical protein